MNTRSFRLLPIFFIAIGGSVPAGGHAVVSITANLDGRTCAVGQRVTSCMTLPNVLTEELGVTYRTSLSISAEGCGREAAARARAVADNLKAAGFTRVAVAGFLTEPNVRCAP